MLENVKIKGVHASRYIISWFREGKQFNWIEGYDEFEDWLKSLKLSEEEIDCIMEMARNGKFELEASVRAFTKNIKDKK